MPERNDRECNRPLVGRLYFYSTSLPRVPKDCATVGFGDIESSNIVGYTTGNTVNDLFTPMGACFFNVGEDALGVQKLAMDNAPDMGALEMWVVNKNLGTTSKAYWFLEYEDIPAGWFDEDGEVAADFDLAKGQGVLLKTGDAGVTSSQAGEVGLVDVTDYPVNDLFTVFANPYATNLPISNISFKNAPDMGALQMWIVNKSLGTVKTAYWFLEFEDIPAGWFDEDGEVEVNHEIEPGCAVLLKTGDTGVTMDVASPVTK